MTKCTAVVAGCGFALTAVLSAAAQPNYVIDPGTFSAPWTVAPPLGISSSTSTVTPQAAGGCAGEFLQVDNTVGFMGRVWQFIEYPPLTWPYDQIREVHFTQDAFMLSTSFGQGQGTGPSFRVGPTPYVYWPRATTPFSSCTQVIVDDTGPQCGLTYGNFVGLDTSLVPIVTPTFPTGSPVTFGFYRTNSSSGGGYSNSAGVDNVMICLSLCGCDSIDFNGDGIFPDNQDVIDFLDVFAGAPCSTGNCNDLDFNNDCIFPSMDDLIAFLSVFAGSPC